MKELIKKNWINGLAISFLFTAFLMSLKIIIENGWFPPELRAVLGCVLGFTSLFLGVVFHKRNKVFWSEAVAGIGVATLYATLAYVSFNDELNWSLNAMLIAIVGVTMLTAITAVQINMRLLYLTATIGGLITPLVIKADATDDFLLFIYLLVINVGTLFVSARKNWAELKPIALIFSVAIYSTYYVMFDPIYWVKPFLYLSALFIVYMIGIFISVWNSDDNEVNLDSYMSVINALNFIFWSNYIFKNFEISQTIPMLFVGITFVLLGVILVNFKQNKLTITNALHIVLGVILLAMACSDSGMILSNGLNYVLNAFIWIVLIWMVYLFANAIKSNQLFTISYLGFFILTSYWYVAAWKVEWIAIFGVRYIPFLNLGALIWILLAFSGFYFAKNEFISSDSKEKTQANFSLSNTLALVSHIIVGGLLTIQISNLWLAYQITFLDEQLALSICWLIYALTIYVWSNLSGQYFFRTFGAFVIIVTSVKIFFWDISGTTNIQKVILLLVAGLLTIIIGKVHSKVNSKQETVDS